MTLDADLFLASQSPRRRELLAQIGVRFDIVSVHVLEQHQPGETPADYVTRLACAKARAGAAVIAQQHPHSQCPVLGADTLVVCAGEILEKPQDKTEGLAMLARLSGVQHQVMTAVALCRGEQVLQRLVTSDVRMRVIDPGEAERYWHTGEPQDKAGGYAIQGFGAVFVEHLSGSYSNVVGLPICETQHLLSEMGVACWHLGVTP